MQVDAWMWSVSSLKFDLRNQPSLFVLSVIDKVQSPFFSRPAIMSVHGVITAARFSKRLFDARNWRWEGISKRHAKHLWLYPPKPAWHESKRYMCVGLRWAIWFKLIPSCAFLMKKTIRWRSSQNFGVILVCCRRDFDALRRSSQRWLRKWLTKGTTRARWLKRPIVDSNSFAFT